VLAFLATAMITPKPFSFSHVANSQAGFGVKKTGIIVNKNGFGALFQSRSITAPTIAY